MSVLITGHKFKNVYNGNVVTILIMTVFLYCFIAHKWRLKMCFNLKQILMCGVALLALTACGDSSNQQERQRPATVVGVVNVKARPVILYSEMPGRTLAYETAEVRPEVTGIIRERVYQEGAFVNKGDVLYHIDDEMYKASYEGAKANLAKAEAAVTLTQLKERRMSELRKKNAISQQDYDEARASYLQANADLQSAKAAVQTAKINLDRTEISAPLSGLISKSSVSVGTLVSNNQMTALATIYQIDPMNVDLTESVEKLVKAKRQNDLGTDEEASRNLQNLNVPVKLLFDDGKEYSQVGKLEFVDVGVDVNTSTMTLRASFANPKYHLMPGMFVRAKVQIGVDEYALLIPQKAVLRDNRGNAYVFIAEGLSQNQAVSEEAPAKAKSVRKFVTLGDTYGENWLVTEGLKDGDSVILEGIQKVTDNGDLNVIKINDINIPKDADYLVENSMKKNEIATTVAESTGGNA